MPPTNPPADVAAKVRRLIRRLLRKLGRWCAALALTCVILVSLAGICVVLAPVSLLTRNLTLEPAVLSVYGSPWRGQAELAGGYRLNWDSRARLFWLPHLESDFQLTGADTQITGSLRSTLGGLAMADVSGRAGPGLASVIPGAWLCDMTAQVSGVSFAWSWFRASAEGAITTPPGQCRKNGQEIDMPLLTATLLTDGRDVVIKLTEEQSKPLANVRIRRDRVFEIAIQPAAADVFPSLPRGGPINLQLPF